MSIPPKFSLMPAVLAAALACGVSGHAQQNRAGGTLVDRFKQLDRNGDG